MTAMYNEATVIHGTSRVTYNGAADNTVGIGAPPGSKASAPAPTGSASAPRPTLTATAPRPTVRSA